MDLSALRYTFRSLRRHRGYTLLNVGGLAVGLAAAAVILLFVRDELSYDRFHPEAERIYDLNADFEYRDELTLFLRGMPVAMGPTLEEELPAVELAVRWDDRQVTFTGVGDLDGVEMIQVTDPSFFEMFGFRLINGSPESVLAQPEALVFTRTAAERYFGETNPVGATLQAEGGETYTVTGIVEDPPHNTEFSFEILGRHESLAAEEVAAAESSVWNPVAQKRTFIRLAEGTSEEDFLAAAGTLLTTHMGESAEKLTLRPQRLVDLHLYRDRGSSGEGLYGSITYVWMFSGIALLILLIACINYTNLATARALQRAREVGIRKAVGAQRGELIRRFLGESVALCTVSTVAAVIIVDWGLPAFSRLTGKEIAANWLSDPWLIPGFAALTLIVGTLAGVYPSLVLSRFQPVRALKGRVGRRETNAGIRKGLVSLQFVMSVGLIICTVVMLRQLHFMLDRELGLEPEQVVSIRIPAESKDRFPILKTEFRQIPSVQSVAGGNPISNSWLLLFDDDVPVRPSEGFIYASTVDEDYVRTMEMQLVAGRDLAVERTAPQGRPILINEKAVEDMQLADPIGTVLRSDMDDESGYEVVGVVRDYHFQSLKQPIMPLMILQGEDEFLRMVIRIGTEDVQRVLTDMGAAWARVIPDEPFDYSFLDEDFAALYETERRVGRLFTLAAGLAVFVSCLGLFGLAAFSAQQRTKEIGIRKVLGASVAGIVGLVSREFLVLVGIAFVIAAPLAWYAMNRWLEDYAYRIEIGPDIFALAAFLAVVITVATIGWQAIRAATADPVKSLRYE